MEIVLATVVVAAAIAAVLWPLVTSRGAGERSDADERRDELEIAKQNKYREIRDLELDYRAGKLSEDEWREFDRVLRREAMAILAEIDSAPPR